MKSVIATHKQFIERFELGVLKSKDWPTKRLFQPKISPVTPPYPHPQNFSLAATAIKHSQFIWSELVVQEDSGVSSLKIDENLWRPF